MSKLMIKGQQASGTYGNASDIKINEISGLTASNAQEALVALNNSLTKVESCVLLGTANQSTTPITLSESVRNFKFLCMVFYRSGLTRGSIIIPTVFLDKNNAFQFSYNWGGSVLSQGITISDNQTMVLGEANGEGYVYGIDRISN